MQKFAELTPVHLDIQLSHCWTASRSSPAADSHQGILAFTGSTRANIANDSWLQLTASTAETWKKAIESIAQAKEYLTVAEVEKIVERCRVGAGGRIKID